MCVCVCVREKGRCPTPMHAALGAIEAMLQQIATEVSGGNQVEEDILRVWGL